MATDKNNRKRLIKLWPSVALLACGWAAAPLATAAAPAAPDTKIIAQTNVMVRMRDGVGLSTDIYRPAKEGRYPVILFRDAYGNGSGGAAGAKSWVEKGYVYLVQDVRGRYDSEGHYYPYISEATDGYDAQQWAGSQPWSSGKVGMLGSSYRAAVQWMPAHLRSPAVAAIIPAVTPFNYYKDVMYPGGAFQLANRIDWGFYMAGRTGQSGIDVEKMWSHLPLKTLDQAFGYDLPYWRDWVGHPTYDEYWRQFDSEARIEQMDVPALSIGGWYDAILRGTLTSYTGMRTRARTERARNSQKLIIGPWDHSINGNAKLGEIDFGTETKIDLSGIQTRWFDHWLKGEDTGFMKEPRVRIFVMGENRWRSEDEWPLARTRYTKYYLQSAGKANTAGGDGKLATKLPGGAAADTYIYDPSNPVPTRGGNILPAKLGPGPVDQAPLAGRDDILVFSTPALEQDTEVTGPITVTLYASSSALDTDFTAKLVDVHPDGKAYNIADSIIRARYRNSFEKPELLEPGKVYPFTIDLLGTSNLFKKGHRIRVDISSSNFPRFDRNPNTGHAFGEDAELRKATQTIHHSRQYPSHITLPIIPR
ncbi:CocE/NonD family hydrolase [Steroidobacter sp.]|uniref:CocE/NonD family hydrolase n=1 Tax=Steroidobacter sp. TaxID=1978227 RepID=UPI001A5D910E|nr:CocE/NonD family hydrolase [Steroidobacter sp.]MBL8268561.1 CocE/NonD family hydrolase [Steroidobacter sp.]